MTGSGSHSKSCDTSDASDLQAQAEYHLPLVASLVRRFPPGLYDPQDLYQQGCIGLMKALRRFRADMGVQFSTYAVPVILGEMRALSRMQAAVHVPRPERELRQRVRNACQQLTAKLCREPTVNELADALNLPPCEIALLTEEIVVTSADDHEHDGNAPILTLRDRDDWMTRVELRDLLSHLPETDGRLLTSRYLDGCTQAETARKLGLTQVQVSRREAVLKRQLYQMWYGA